MWYCDITQTSIVMSFQPIVLGTFRSWSLAFCVRCQVITSSLWSPDSPLFQHPACKKAILKVSCIILTRYTRSLCPHIEEYKKHPLLLIYIFVALTHRYKVTLARSISKIYCFATVHHLHYHVEIGHAIRRPHISKIIHQFTRVEDKVTFSKLSQRSTRTYSFSRAQRHS